MPRLTYPIITFILILAAPLFTTINGAVSLTTPLHAGQTAQAPTRNITLLRPGIYRTQNNRHHGLLIDTPDGIIIFDTISKGFASWLKGEIKQRFNKPVRYVIYSHNHADHISGGEVFADDQPIYIAHELAKDSMVRMGVKTRFPDHTFSERFNIEIGGIKVELRYHGANDGRGSISLLVPSQKLLSVMDWVLIGRLPYRGLARYNVDGVIRSLYEIEKLDFTLASPGHAKTGDKAGIRVVRRYLETARAAVIEGIRAKTPLDELVKSVRQQLAADAEFRNLAMFDEWVELNIRGIHRQIAAVEGHGDVE